MALTQRLQLAGQKTIAHNSLKRVGSVVGDSATSRGDVHATSCHLRQNKDRGWVSIAVLCSVAGRFEGPTTTTGSGSTLNESEESLNAILFIRSNIHKRIIKKINT